MSKIVFAQAIIAKLKDAIGASGKDYTSTTATTAMGAVAQAITEYLIANTTVNIAYAGIISTGIPHPDTVVADSFKITGVCAPPRPSGSFNSWIKEVETNIIAGFQLAPMGTAGIVFPQKPFANPGIVTVQSNLKAEHNVQDTDPQLKVWEVVCGGLIDWINGTAFNSTPGAATRPTGPSTGTATITQITIT